MSSILKLNDFNSIKESRDLSDEEVEDYFIEFYDRDKFSMKRGYVTPTGDDWRFFTDISGVKNNTLNCIEVRIAFDYKKSKIRGEGGMALNSFDELEEAAATIKQFYSMIKIEPSYTLKVEWDEIKIYFYIIGTKVNDKVLDKKSEIENYLKQIGELYKKRTGFRNISLKNPNWLDIRVPKSQPWTVENAIRRFFRNIADGNYVPTNETGQKLVEIFDEIREKGYRVNVGGGDLQIVISLK
jgi:hypothetical protein